MENASPAWGSADAWTIDPIPVLQIGALEGEEPYQFFSPYHVRSYPDGRIAIGERRPLEIRIFGPDGTFVRSIGREGEGPGEFRSPPSFWVIAPDTLLTWDSGGRRLSWFDGEGGLIREQSLAQPPPGPTSVFGQGTGPWNVGSAGLLLGYRSLTRSQGEVIRSPRDAPGAYSQHQLFYLIDPAANKAVQVQDTFPFSRTEAQLLISWEPVTQIALADHPPRVIASGWWEWQLAEYGADGAKLRLVRAAVPRISGAEMADSLRAAFSDDQIRVYLDRQPDSFPAIASRSFVRAPQPTLVSVSDGHLWVRRAPWGLTITLGGGRFLNYMGAARSPAIFDVLDDSRRWLGTVEFDPALGQIRDIGPDHVFTVWMDSLSVPYVRVYRIVKGGG